MRLRWNSSCSSWGVPLPEQISLGPISSVTYLISLCQNHVEAPRDFCGPSQIQTVTAHRVLRSHGRTHKAPARIMWSHMLSSTTTNAKYQQQSLKLFTPIRFDISLGASGTQHVRRWWHEIPSIQGGMGGSSARSEAKKIASMLQRRTPFNHEITRYISLLPRRIELQHTLTQW